MTGSRVLARFGGWSAITATTVVVISAGRAPAQCEVQLSPEQVGTVEDWAPPKGMVPSIPAPELTCQPRCVLAPCGTRVELDLCDTITKSVLGKPDPNTWRPLPLAKILSEGWNESWV